MTPRSIPPRLPAWSLLGVLALAGCSPRTAEPAPVVPIPPLPAQQAAATPAQTVQASGALKLLSRFGGSALVAEQEAQAVAFSPDSRQLASGGGKGHSIVLWDARTGQPIGSLSTDDVTPSKVSYSPDGKLIAASGVTRRIALFDATSRSLLRHLDGHQDNVYKFAFSPDSKRMASADGDGVVLLWDLTSNAAPRTLVKLPSSTGELAFSPDGRSLAVPSGDGSLGIWDSATGKKLRQSPPAASRAIHGVAWTPDGSALLSGETLASGGEVVFVRDAASFAVRHTLQGHTFHVNAVATTPDGRLLLSAGGDGTLRSWDMSTGALVRTMSADGAALWTMSLSADGELVAAAGRGRKIHLFRTRTGDAVFPGQDHQASVDQLAFSPDGKSIASSDSDGNIIVRELASGTPRLRLPRQPRWVSALSFSPDGSRLMSVSDGAARFWDPRSGAELGSISVGRMDALVYSPDGRFLVASNDTRIVRMLDATTGVEVRSFGQAQPHDDMRQNLMTPSSVSFSPDGTLLAVARWDQPIQIWQTSQGSLVKTLPGTMHVTFSPRGDLIAGNVGSISKGGTSLQIRLWNVSTGAELFTVDGTTKPLFSRDGRFVMAYCDEAEDGPVRGTPQGRGRAIKARSLRVWSASDGKLVGQVAEPGRFPVSLAVSADGRKVASGGQDATIEVFELADAASTQPVP